MLKAERFEVFLQRLAERRAAETAEEALDQIAEALNTVEDEFTHIPYDPARWQDDGRMYAPQRDAERSVPGAPELRRYRSRAHNTVVSEGGAIEIREISGGPIFDKVGADGRSVEDWRNR